MIRYDDMQIAILIANLFSTAACIVMVVLGFVRKKENLVKGQAIQLGLLAVSNTLLQAYSGTIGNVIGVVRCFILPKTQKPLFWKILFIAVQFVITLLMMIFVTKDWAVWQCWIPFTYAVILTCVLDSKSVVVFKIAIAIAQALFFFFDLYYVNYGSMAADLLTVFTNVTSVIFYDLKAAKKAQAAVEA